MDKIGVYQIKINNKIYVGSTVQGFSTRWGNHISALSRGKHKNLRLQRLYNKYGKEAFFFTVLEVVNNPEECVLCEQKWIDLLMPEYNMCPVARSSYGIIRSAETRERMSKAMTGIKHPKKRPPMSQEARKIISNAQKGNKHCLGRIWSEESRKKLSESHKGYVPTMEVRQKIGEKNRGRKPSEETREKLRIANSGKKRTEEEKRRMSEASKGNKNAAGPRTEEAKQRMKVAQKEAWIRRKERKIVNMDIKTTDDLSRA